MAVCDKITVRVRLPDERGEVDMPSEQLGGTWTETGRETSTVMWEGVELERIDRITFSAGILGSITLVLNNPSPPSE